MNLNPFRRRPSPLSESLQRFERFTAGLRESGLTMNDLLNQLDQQGFARVGDVYGDMLDLHEPDRETLVRRSRMQFLHEPLTDRVLSMWSEYAFGRPWTVTANDERFQPVFDATWTAVANRRQFGQEGLRRSSNALLVDGERWYAFFPVGDMVKARTIEPLEMKAILSNPEDVDEVWYYRRTWRDAATNHLRTAFYRDWNYDGNDPHPGLTAQPSWGEVDTQPVPNAWVSHLAVNTLGMRGYPLMTSAFDWVRAHREFMRDRSTISAARAQIVAKVTVKGGPQSVSALASAFETDISPPDAKGKTLFGNEGLNYETVGMPADGASAQNDQRALRSMAALPSGLPDFVLGDTGSANLATATALERPLDTMFAAYQGLWVEFLEDLARHIGIWVKYSGDAGVTVDPPDIFVRDPAQQAEALARLIQVIPAIGASPQVVKMVLVNLGLEDVEGAMEVIEPRLGEEPDESETLEALREALNG